MNIFYFGIEAFGGKGGIALYTRDLLRAFNEAASVKSIYFYPLLKGDISLEKIPNKVNISKKSSVGKFGFIVAAIKTIAIIKKDECPYIICGHINLLLICFLLRLTTKTNLILLGYGIDVWSPPNLLSKVLVKYVDKIWLISNFTKERMNSWAKLEESKYSILPNAINTSKYSIQNKNKSLLKKYRLNNKKIIMSMGRLSKDERYKGFDEIIDALPELIRINDKITYMIVGDGDDKIRLQDKVHSMGLGDHVIFLGYIDENLKSQIFSLADVFVMPSFGEGFGFVFLESLACGVPTIASVDDGGREALRYGKLGKLASAKDRDSIIISIIDSINLPKVISQDLYYFSTSEFNKRVFNLLNGL